MMPETTDIVTYEGFAPACAFDHWNGYEHYTRDNRQYEIRLPRDPFTWGYSVWRWSDNTGYHIIGNRETIEEARALISVA